MGRFFCPVLLKYAAKPLAPKSVKKFFTAYVFLYRDGFWQSVFFKAFL